MPEQKFFTEVARFPSKSQAGKEYAVRRDQHGNLSCDCPAWRFKKGGTRTCQHVEAVASGVPAPALRPPAKLQEPEPTGDVVAGLMEDIQKATNYVRQGLNELRSGKPVSVATSRAYGCSIKYRNGAA